VSDPRPGEAALRGGGASGGAPLDVVVLGRSITSSRGDGHATTWRALLGALAARGHRITFLERDLPRHAAHRDLTQPPFCRTALYDSVAELREAHGGTLHDADAILVGSSVPEGAAVLRLALALSRGTVAFYDLDTPATLARLRRGDCESLDATLIPRLDLYLSFTGGPTLAALERELGAPLARALHGSADPELPRPGEVPPSWDLGYVGTYGADRQPAIEELFLEAARRRPARRFAVAGPPIPASSRWPANVERIEHLPPAGHAGFYAAQRFTLHVTRADLVRVGWSPSERLFEAAASATPVLSDPWPGLETFFEPGRELLIVRTCGDVLRALQRVGDEERRALGERARRRVLAEHTAAHRARALEGFLREAREQRARRRATHEEVRTEAS
jgi:spore maturation protein CgeB